MAHHGTISRHQADAVESHKDWQLILSGSAFVLTCFTGGDRFAVFEKRLPKISQDRTSIAFLYLGRRGALGQFTRELMQAAEKFPEHEFDFIVSSDSEFAEEIEKGNASLLAVPTFSRPYPLNALNNYFAARRLILERLAKQKPLAVITLMSHVWTPLLAPAIKRLGVKYAPVIHDAKPHPGDKTAWLTRWLRRDARHGDTVITLSQAVAEKLAADKIAKQEDILPLFLPDLVYGSTQRPRTYDPSHPLRVIFFGRVMAYKGLSHFVDAVEMLRQDGVQIEVGLAGAGDLGNDRARLEKLGAEIINRWISEREVTDILDRYDAVVCPHVEASQSGVAAVAFGHCMPVVAMPTGGITEQVVDSKTGILAKQVTARALADAIRRLALEAGLYDGISEHLSHSADERSMGRFLREILGEVASLAKVEEGRG